MERRDPYRILQVQPDALPEVVSAAYRALAKTVHPDRNSPATTEWMQDINWAYSIIGNPAARTTWDYNSLQRRLWRIARITMPSGKYRHRPVTQVPLSYLRWALDHGLFGHYEAELVGELIDLHAAARTA